MILSHSSLSLPPPPSLPLSLSHARARAHTRERERERERERGVKLMGTKMIVTLATPEVLCFAFRSINKTTWSIIREWEGSWSLMCKSLIFFSFIVNYMKAQIKKKGKEKPLDGFWLGTIILQIMFKILCFSFLFLAMF
jgi:hypothetical protein